MKSLKFGIIKQTDNYSLKIDIVLSRVMLSRLGLSFLQLIFTIHSF